MSRSRFCARGLAVLLAVALPSPTTFAVPSPIDIEERPAPLAPRRQRSEGEELRVRASALLVQGRILERRGELPTALACYQRAYRYDHAATIALKQIVPLAVELGRVGEATRYAVRLAETRLDDPSLAEKLAVLLADQLRYDKSLQMYQRVLELQNGNGNLSAINLEMGRLYFLSDKYKQAAQCFSAVLKGLDAPATDGDQDVRSAIEEHADIVYGLMAEAFLESGDFDRARDLFRRAAQRGKPQEWLDLQLARVDVRDQKPESARKRIEDYIRKRLQFAGREPYVIMQRLMVEGDTSDQSLLAQFRDWVAQDPENFPLLTHVADLVREKGMAQEAASLYERVVEKQPSLTAYRGLITSYRELRDSEKLVDTLGRIADRLEGLQPLAPEIDTIVQDPELLAQLFGAAKKQLKTGTSAAQNVATACGLLAIDASDFAAADEFLPALDTHPKSNALLTNLGLELLIAGEHGRAAQVFQRASESQVTAAEKAIFLYYAAKALTEAGDTDAALQAARQAVRLDREVPLLRMEPATILYRAARYDEAHQHYSEWLDAYGNNFSVPGIRDAVREAKFHMSNICIANDQWDDAMEWLEQVLDEFPDDAAALNDLGYLMADRGVFLLRALDMIKRAVANQPENVAYRDSLGWVLHHLGRHKQAIEQLRIATEGTAPDPVILDHLGDAHEATGQIEKARKAWRRALDRLGDDNQNQEQLIEALNKKLKRHDTESN